jgi:hypothetical protein
MVYGNAALINENGDFTLIILRLTTIKNNSKKEQQETSIYP